MATLRHLIYALIGALALSQAVAAAEGDGAERTGAVRRWIAQTIEKAVSGPDMRVTIGDIRGAVPFDFTVSEVSIADRDGVWLRLEELRLNLALTALLTARARADLVEATRVTVERAPVAPATPDPAPEPEPAGPAPLLPNLPVGIAVDRLVVEELRLGEALLGAPAVLRVNGSIDLARRGDGLSVTLNVARIGDGSGEASLDAHFNPETRQLDVALTASEPAGGIAARALGMPDLPPVRATLNGNGTLDDWKARLTAAAEGMAELSADATITRPDGAADHLVTLTATADAAGLAQPPLEPLLAQPATLEARWRMDAAAGDVRIETLTLQTAPASLSADGTLGGWGRTVDVTARARVADLSAFSGLAGQPLAGSATLAGPVRRDAGGTLTATLDGTTTGLETGTPADAVLGDAPTLHAEAAVAPDGAARLPVLRIQGRHGALTGSAALAAGRLEADATLELPELSPVGDALGTPLSGAATVAVQAAGPTEALRVQAHATTRDLTVSGRPLGDGALTATAEGLPQAPQGRLQVATEAAGQTLTAEATYALEGRTLRLSDIAAGSEDNRVTGALRVALDTLAAEGRLEGRLPDLKALSELAGMPLQGNARLDLLLDAADGRQRAVLDGRADGLRVGEREAPTLAARTLTVKGTVTDLLASPAGEARLHLEDGVLAGGEIASLTAGVDGSLERVEFRASAAGTGRTPLDLDLAGTAEQAGTLSRIRLTRLKGQYQGEDFRLAGPATVELGERHYVVSGLRLTSGGARLSADAGLREGRLEGTLKLDQIPVGLARLASPTLRLDGTLNGSAELGGSLASPRGDARLRVAGLSAKQAAQAGVPGIDARADIAWRDGRLSLDGGAQARGGGARVRFTAAAPLRLDADTMALSVPERGALSGGVEGTLNAALVNDLLAASGDRARGTVRVDVRVDGTVGDPRLGGAVTLANGRYESRATGAVVSDISARIEGDGDVFAIRSFRGRTLNGGTLRAEGTIRPAAPEGGQLDLRLLAENARIVQIDIVTATIDAELAATGSFTDIRVAGPVKVERAEAQIPNRLPPSVVDLDVVEVGGGRETGPQRPAAGEAPETPGPTIALDIPVSIPNQVFVRGRGLSAEFGGDLHVGGTAAEPTVTGRLSILKGSLGLLTESFNFERGNIDFDGERPIDPRLDLLAAATANGVTAQVQIGGTARNPTLKLSSPQGLPQDEVLARVLFGKPASELGPAEAVQIAQSAASLAGLGGNGPGLLDTVRRKLGVDRLSLSQGPDGRGGGVEAGRYVSDRVYVGVEQGVVGGTGTRAKVEVEITDNIKLEADVGANAGSSVGLTWEWEY